MLSHNSFIQPKYKSRLIMLNFTKSEKELNKYSQHIIIHDNTRYVPASGFEFLQRMYQEQKVYVTKLEKQLIELETKIIKTELNKKKDVKRVRAELLKNYIK